GARRRVHVYTPPGYGLDANRKYPVLYLLHGSGDNDSHWTLLGRADVIADNLIADKKSVPVIIPMPDGHVIERRGNANEQARISARDAFEKDLLESVVPLVESSYRVQADREHRAVAGLSMGGGQSLAVGLKHPDRFAWVGAFSASVPANDSVIAGLRAHPE